MFSECDFEYLTLIRRALVVGSEISTRNSVCRRLIGCHVGFDYSPLVSVRRTAWKNALREWEWFMSGSDYIGDLHPKVRHWWNPWADEEGRVRYNYSKQFRGFGDEAHLVDQVQNMIDGIRDHPYSRRNVATTWHPRQMTDPLCPITNCHGTIIQAFVEPDDSLHLVTYQRSVDVVCGLPHNWIQYWAFLMWLAHRGGRRAGSLTWLGGDVHVYKAHEPLAWRMLEQENNCREAPGLVYTPTTEDFLAADFTLDGEYTPLLEDRAEMIV
jgi:thymidylate synthase